MDKPIVAITMGDVCGIGPEVIAKSLIQEDIIANCHPLVIGNSAILTETARDLGISLTTNKISDVKEIFFGIDIGLIVTKYSFLVFNFCRLFIQ